jgi:antitoxin HicB
MHYNAKITKSEGVYQVFFPDLPNVITFGETKDEALKNASDALNGALESDYEAGFSLPVIKQKAGKGFYPVDVLPHVELPYRLRELRKGRSQSEIAKELGISYQVYQRLETPGKCNPTLKTVEKLSAVFGKRVELAFV